MRELSKNGVNFDLYVTDDVTCRVKVGIFDISGLVTLPSTISMLSSNKANESAWIVSQDRGVGAPPPPLRFFADSEKTAALRAARFWGT